MRFGKLSHELQQIALSFLQIIFMVNDVNKSTNVSFEYYLVEDEDGNDITGIANEYA